VKSDSEPRCIPNLLEGNEMAKRRKYTDQFKAKVALERRTPREACRAGRDLELAA
jgi:hypothetical protein